MIARYFLMKNYPLASTLMRRIIVSFLRMYHSHTTLVSPTSCTEFSIRLPYYESIDVFLVRLNDPARSVDVVV